VGQLTLVLGGARSGKSAFAERLAATIGERILYVATAEAGDPEMEERVRRHRAARPLTWRTIEAPLEPLAGLSQDDSLDGILLDSVTLWISNLYLRVIGADPEPSPELVSRAESVTRAGLALLSERQRRQRAELILVSDKVGLGVVPDSALGRGFRDILGLVNQELAAQAERVFLIVAGMPLQLKGGGQ